MPKNHPAHHYGLEGRRLRDDSIEAHYLLVYADRQSTAARLRAGRQQQEGGGKTGKGDGTECATTTDGCHGDLLP